MLKKTRYFVALLLVLFFTSNALSTKFPHIPFIVTGKIVDWDNKSPLSDVKVLIFLNDHTYADNNGWVGKYDYPNFPASDTNGNFEGHTRLYRGEKIELKKVEVITLREGYRTERFVFMNPQFSLSPDKTSGTIHLPEIALLKTRVGT